MSPANGPLWIGSAGVTLLLVAFALNILDKISEQGRTYLSMNVVGSLAAAWYAYVGHQIPFLVLEIAWAAAAAVRLVIVIRKGSRQTREP